ncbi:MAG: hypothetical protein J5960_06775 [Desulfovibrio sp.]|nr:hypothetical protein [Desulfovibrio sp.]
MSTPDFPVLGDVECAQVAASLAAAACSLVAGKDGLGAEVSLQYSQVLFQRQLAFLKNREWPEPDGGPLGKANWT